MVHSENAVAPQNLIRRASHRRLSATEVLITGSAFTAKQQSEVRVHNVDLYEEPGYCKRSALQTLGSWKQVKKQTEQEVTTEVASGDFLRSSSQSVWAVAHAAKSSTSAAVRAFVSNHSFPVVPLEVTEQSNSIVEMYTEFAQRCPALLDRIVLVVDSEHVAIRRHFGDMLTVQQFLHPKCLGLIWLDFTNGDAPKASFEWLHEGNMRSLCVEDELDAPM